MVHTCTVSAISRGCTPCSGTYWSGQYRLLAEWSRISFRCCGGALARRPKYAPLCLPADGHIALSSFQVVSLRQSSTRTFVLTSSCSMSERAPTVFRSSLVHSACHEGLISSVEACGAYLISGMKLKIDSAAAFMSAAPRGTDLKSWFYTESTDERVTRNVAAMDSRRPTEISQRNVGVPSASATLWVSLTRTITFLSQAHLFAICLHACRLVRATAS